MNRLRTASTLAAGAVFALALGGVALASDGADDSSGAVPMLPNGDVATPAPTFSDDSGNDSSDDSATPAPSSSSSSPSDAGAISLDAAKVIAVRAAGGGRVTKAESETEHGRAVWDIEVRNGSVEHDIDVDRATGAVVRHRQDADDKGGSRNRVRSSDDNGTDDRGRGRGSDDTKADDRGRGSDDTQADDRGRGGDDTQADDRGRGGDDTQADDKGRRHGGHGSDD
ncbi:PepSY domain-containing protein [Actinoplanes sp. NPDC049548]|uniref:PepSY domain-containing protein n=1 Tax=Actinoplanes sp. NPDC049548 TaxID=3155152 RepID=UPI00341D04B3